MSDHMHEWHLQQILVKSQIPDGLLVDWFTKSLLPQIAEDVAMSRAISEEEAIRHAQHLDLIYSQAHMLYNIIPHALWSSNKNIKLSPKPHADGLVASTSSTAATQLVGKFSHMTLSNNSTNTTPVTTTTTSSAQSSELYFMQTTTPKTS